MTTKEIWKPIKGFEGLYEISSMGNVKSLRRGKTMKTTLNRGYAYVGLHKDGFTRKCKVHRLVAETFIPNPENKKDVNHKDYNRSNNNVENLEWMTRKENAIYSSERMKHPKVYKTNTGEHHISYDGKNNRYIVTLILNGIRKGKQFKDIQDAIKYRDQEISIAA